MYHYEYVSRQEAKPYREKVVALLERVQNIVRPQFTFQYRFIGSSSRDMITCDRRTNKGFDFDVNLIVHDKEKRFSPEEIRGILCCAFQQNMGAFGFTNCENSTRVITVKKVNFWLKYIEYSCDYAIVSDTQPQQYIRFNKGRNTCTWEWSGLPYHALESRADCLRDRGCWGEVRERYLLKKNTNQNPHKHSRSLYAEAVNECYQRYLSGTRA